MKANRKFVEDEEAVSAVIGVILMVAITVAIAATVYVYVSGMITPETTGKTISAIQTKIDTSTHNVTFKVTNADAGLDWTQVKVSWANGSVAEGSIIDGQYAVVSGNVEVGDYFIIDFADAGTYIADLIYEGNIIWTSPTVAV